jgi:acetoin utilization deacetylase AcuC-like enzyme
MSLTVITHPACLDHRPPAGHPERPERLEAALKGIAQLEHRQLRANEVTREQLERAHRTDYLDRLDSHASSHQPVALDADTWLGPGTLKAARLATGATCQAVDEVMSNDDCRAFALVRPPGHHAEPGQAMGFCYYSSVAVAALHALAKHNLSRVAICDFDVHHGNGTEAVVGGHDGVRFMSSHQSPLYPGTGLPGKSPHFNVINEVLTPGSGSNEFRDLWLERLLPRLDIFKPELILVSAGFDAHWRDPLAQIQLKDEDYYWIGEQLRDLAISHARGRLVATLEGGYDLKALEESVLAFSEGIV